MPEDKKNNTMKESVTSEKETSVVTETVKLGKSNMMVGGIITALVVAVILIYGGISLFVYRFDTNPTAQAIARVLPIPAAVVNWAPISYDNYLIEAKLTQQFYEFTDGSGASAAPTRGEVLDVLVQKQLIENYVKAHDITVTDQEIEEQVTALLASIGMTQAEFDDFIVSSFGVDVDVYREHAILPDMYRAKVAEYLDSNDTSAKENADAAYERLQAGGVYEDLVSELSEDTTSAADSGSIGSFLTESIPEEVRDDVTALAVGEYSKPLYTPGSYAIIKMDAIHEAGSEVDGQVVEEKTYVLKGIFFFTPGLDEWLTEQTDNARIYKLVRNVDSSLNLLTDADREKADNASKQDTSGTLEGDVIDNFEEPATTDSDANTGDNTSADDTTTDTATE